MSAAAYSRLREAVWGGDRLAEPGAAVAGPGPGRPPEAELQSRWFAGEFGADFHSTQGWPVRVTQFGEWNCSAGPDFRHTVVEVAGKPLKGSLELDWDARDWERHGHAENPAYEDVALHVFFHAPEGETFFTRTKNHRDVAQVRIDLAAFPLAGPPPAPAEAKCGRCSFPLAALGAAELRGLLEAAARYRLERKGRRLQRLAELHGRDQMLFQELAAALGYRRNKLPMTMLAQRLPLRLLMQHQAGAEALLFGAAGFLETKIYERAAPETREYLRGLWETWWKHRAEFSGVEPPRWVLAGARPQNHPQRRLGALSVLARQWKKIRAAFDAAEAPPLEEALAGLRHDYWDWHYTLSSARAAKPMALVGGTRIQEILANLFFPCALARGNFQWAACAALPAVLENESTRRAALRLLGRRPDAAQWQKKLFHQQALLQLYEDFCLQDHSDCAQCLFPEQLARWPDVSG